MFKVNNKGTRTTPVAYANIVLVYASIHLNNLETKDWLEAEVTSCLMSSPRIEELRSWGNENASYYDYKWV